MGVLCLFHPGDEIPRVGWQIAWENISFKEFIKLASWFWYFTILLNAKVLAGGGFIPSTFSRWCWWGRWPHCQPWRSPRRCWQDHAPGFPFDLWNWIELDKLNESRGWADICTPIAMPYRYLQRQFWRNCFLFRYNFARIVSADICTALQWGCRYPLNP